MWFRVDIFFHHFVVVRFVLFLVFVSLIINRQRQPVATLKDTLGARFNSVSVAAEDAAPGANVTGGCVLTSRKPDAAGAVGRAPPAHCNTTAAGVAPANRR